MSCSLQSFYAVHPSTHQLIINKKKSIISLNEQDDCVFGTLHECLSNLPRNVDLMGWEMILVDSRCMFEKLSPRDLLRQSSEFLRDEVMSHAPTSFEVGSASVCVCAYSPASSMLLDGNIGC